MATEWKSQQRFDEGKYYLQFETDDRDKFKFMEKMAQTAIDGHSDRIVILPCKVGNTVYRVVEMGTGIHFKQVGRCGIGHSQGYKIVPCEEKIKRFIRTVEVSKNNFFDVCENFGKTVFLTREEAEAKLKGEQ